MDITSDGTEDSNLDIPLETKMESLEISETSSNSDCSRKHSLRKRIPQINKTEGKRRVIIKPKKRLNTESNADSENINEIYLSKKIKRFAPNLETIFEEPKLTKTNDIMYTELKKKRRFLIFDQNNQGKIKKRQRKVKRLFGKSALKKKRSSMDMLLKKLCEVE